MENKYILFVVLGVVAEMSLQVSCFLCPLASYDYAPPPCAVPAPPCAAPAPPCAFPAPVPVSLLPVPTPLPINIPRAPCPQQSVTIPNIILALLPPTTKTAAPVVKPCPAAAPAPLVIPIPQPKPYFVPSLPCPPTPCV